VDEKVRKEALALSATVAVVGAVLVLAVGVVLLTNPERSSTSASTTRRSGVVCA
jgi:hypothetical protein